MELRQILLRTAVRFIPKILKYEIQKGLKERLAEIEQSNLDRNESWSQEGEDLVLSKFFGHKKQGFYIDIGAHHPLRFSNTYKFYRQGWYGINIDAMPGCMQKFNELRERDINIECPIALGKKAMKFYLFNEPALNTFSKVEAERKNGKNNYWIKEEIILTGHPLNEILNKYLPSNQDIDFMSIDVEGLDFDVLKSNDWNKYKPNVILIESLQNSTLLTLEHPIGNLLSEEGYVLFAKTINTYFYRLIK